MLAKRTSPHKTAAERLTDMERPAQREAQLAELRSLYPAEKLYATADVTARGVLRYGR